MRLLRFCLPLFTVFVLSAGFVACSGGDDESPECSSDSDCLDDEICIGGECVFGEEECTDDSDCDSNESCVDGFCESN